MGIGVGMILFLPFFALGLAMAHWGDKLRVNFPFFPGLCAGALVGFWTGLLLTILFDYYMLIVVPLFMILGGVIGRSKNAGLLLEFFACGYGGFMAILGGPMLFFEVSVPITLLIVATILGLLTCLLRIRITDRGIMVADCVMGGALCASWGVFAAFGFLIFPLVAGGGLYVQMKRKKAADMAAVAPAAPAGPACPNCGMPLQPGTKFCPECGQTVAPEAPAVPAASAGPACPGCGLPLKPGAKFCPGCGQRLAPQGESQEKTEE